jgi:aspartate racemase
MHIGLIGGIGPGATDYYYKGLIRALAQRGKDLDLTIAHADAPTLIGNLGQGDNAGQAAIFRKLVGRLQAAGAETAAITSVAGHFCVDELIKVSPLPMIEIFGAVEAAMTARGLTKVGLIGTRQVMESSVYGKLPTVEFVTPAGVDLDLVHQSYVDMAMAGQVTGAQREAFFTVGSRLCENHGAEAIMLGGTDLFLAFDGRDCGFDVVDCAQIHIDALAQAAAEGS